MIPTTLIPITDIKVGDRYRTDLGDIASLAESIRTLGQIQPCVVDQHMNLVAGRRRLAARESLKLPDCPVTFLEVLTEADRFALELEENIQREDTKWQDNVCAVERIHRYKVRENALVGKSWTIIDTGVLVGKGKSYVHYCNELAKYIRAADKDIIAAEGPSEAIKVLAKRAEDVAQKRLAELTIPKVSIPVKATITPTDAPDLLAGLVDDSPVVIPLSKMLVYGPWEEKLQTVSKQFDHIICDPPYAIDMRMLDQTNTGHDNIQRVVDTHQVEQNVMMLEAFIGAAYKEMKDNGFLVMWCDYSMWETLCDNGRDAGFNVQKWPFIWCKTHPCLNQAAQYNTTKNHEPCIIMRKGKALIPKPVMSSYVLASNDSAKATFKHPFAKPFEVWKALIEAVTIPGEVVLDPFAGCGSSTVTALQLNRRVLAIEKDETHWPGLVENVSRFYKTRFNSVRFE